MVYAASAVALAVLALNAASSLALPIENSSEDLIQREFDNTNIEAREVDLEFDARDFGLEEFEERDYDLEEVFERAASSTSAKPTATASAAKSTITAKPNVNAKNLAASKTVTVTHNVKPTGCVKIPSLRTLSRNPFRRLALQRQLRKARVERKRRLRAKKLRAARAKAAKAKAAKAKGKATSTTASSTSATASSTSATSAVAKATITPAPKLPKGAKVKDTKKVGKNGVTTVHRTITAAPTACARSSRRRFPFVRSIDELD